MRAFQRPANQITEPLSSLPSHSFVFPVSEAVLAVAVLSGLKAQCATDHGETVDNLYPPSLGGG